MRRFVLLGALVLLVSACKVKVEQGFELNADGSGEAVMIVGFDQELQDMLASAAPAGQDPFAALTTRMQPGWRSEEWSEGGFKGFRATQDFADPAALQSLVEADFTGEEGLFESFSIVEADGGFRLDGVLSGESLEQSLEGTDGFNFAGAADEMAASFFQASIAVKLPGEVVSHNADQTRGDGTLIWNVGVSDGGRVIRAESRPGSGLPVMPLAAGALVIAVLVAGFVIWRRRRPPVSPIGRLVYGENGEPELVATEGDPFA